jgi:hypothetical protein
MSVYRDWGEPAHSNGLYHVPASASRAVWCQIIANLFLSRPRASHGIKAKLVPW